MLWWGATQRAQETSGASRSPGPGHLAKVPLRGGAEPGPRPQLYAEVLVQYMVQGLLVCVCVCVCPRISEGDVHLCGGDVAGLRVLSEREACAPTIRPGQC